MKCYQPGSAGMPKERRAPVKKRGSQGGTWVLLRAGRYSDYGFGRGSLVGAPQNNP